MKHKNRNKYIKEKAFRCEALKGAKTGKCFRKKLEKSIKIKLKTLLNGRVINEETKRLTVTFLNNEIKTLLESII